MLYYLSIKKISIKRSLYLYYFSSAAFANAKNESATNDAPPTNAPSISDVLNKSLTLLGFTEPPYRILICELISNN